MCQHQRFRSLGRFLFACVFALIIHLPILHAAGMFVTPHGARPMARGGAFVAGADDLNSIYYNPAGLAALEMGATGYSGFADGAFVLQRINYQRSENGILRPAINSDSGAMFGAPLLIPQLGFARKMKFSFGHLSAGLGLWIPYTNLPRYNEPDYSTETGLRNAPNVAPQRYALISLHEGSLAKSTLLAVINPAIAASFLNDKLMVGLGPQLMFVYFRSKLAISSCTAVTCSPEQADFDATVLAQAFAVTPSFNMGIIGKPLPWLKLGASFQFPFYIRSSTGKIDATLPVNEFFNGARVKGRDASMALTLPAILRVGAETNFINNKLHIELAYTYEAWSMHKEIKFQPQGIYFENVKGIDRYTLSTMSLMRKMEDTHTIHLGGEFALFQFLTVRAGAMFETSAVSDRYITILTPDNDKALIALGAAITNIKLLGLNWRFDLSYSHIFQADRAVKSTSNQIYPLNPIRPAQTQDISVGGIGGGIYQVQTDNILFGVSVVR